MKKIINGIENLSQKLDSFRPNVSYIPAEWPPDWSRGDGDETLCVNCGNPYPQGESDAGQPFKFCSTRCERHHYKIEAYRD